MGIKGMNGSKKVEHYEKRFGIIAIETGFISREDLIMALKIQVLEDLSLGSHRLIGSILLDEKLITAGQIQAVLDIMFDRKGKKRKECAEAIQFPQNPGAKGSTRISAKRF